MIRMKEKNRTTQAKKNKEHLREMIAQQSVRVRFHDTMGFSYQLKFIKGG